MVHLRATIPEQPPGCASFLDGIQIKPVSQKHSSFLLAALTICPCSSLMNEEP